MSRREDSVDIFRMLAKEAEKNKQERARLLESLGVEEFFKKGIIRINRRVCLGAECKLCIKSCATNALYWDVGKIGVVKDLCVYCMACVLSCVVDNCIQITRERMDGEKENFGSQRAVFKITEKINYKKRIVIIYRRFPKPRK